MAFRYEKSERLTHLFFFFFNDTATTEISPLPLPAALPIFPPGYTSPPSPHRHPALLPALAQIHSARSQQSGKGLRPSRAPPIFVLRSFPFLLAQTASLSFLLPVHPGTLPPGIALFRKTLGL